MSKLTAEQQEKHDKIMRLAEYANDSEMDKQLLSEFVVQICAQIDYTNRYRALRTLAVMFTHDPECAEKICDEVVNVEEYPNEKAFDDQADKIVQVINDLQVGIPS
jgi:hypothetical protein